MGNIYVAFLLTAIAGLSTGIGSAIAFFSKNFNKKFLSVSLGFSAGVMIYVSMVEMFAESQKTLSLSYGNKTGMLFSVLSFFGGILFIGIIDKLIPAKENPHEQHELKEIRPCENKMLLRSGIFAAVTIALHNFPEGLATFVSALQEPSVAYPIVIAIAIHNIPEGISVAAPIYYATKNKRKAFLLSFLSGLAEPLGAVIGYLILLPFLNNKVFGILYGITAGIMIFISLDELLPAARRYGEHHLSIYSLVAGMAFMALSLWLFI